MIVTNVIDFKPRKAVDNSEIIETIGLKTTGTKEVSLARAIIRPKNRTEEHYHDFLEIYFVEKGKGIMKINNETKNIGNGDNIIIPRKSWHNLENVDDKELIIWCVCVPAFSELGTVLKKLI